MLAAPKRTENRLIASAPSGDSFARDNWREFKAWVTMMAHPKMNRSFFHQGCSFIISLLSKVRKHKSTTIETVCHWLYALGNLARRTIRRLMRFARDILFATLILAVSILAASAYQLFKTDLFDVSKWRFVVTIATPLVMLAFIVVTAKLILVYDEKEDKKNPEIARAIKEAIQEQTKAITTALQQVEQKGHDGE
jgi:hypothetical protein